MTLLHSGLAPLEAALDHGIGHGGFLSGRQH